MSTPGLQVLVTGNFRDATTAVRAALAAEGFGVLTEVDVQATLREKLGEQMEDYLILGVCNPTLAHQALTIDRSVGLLLPCTVVIRATPDAELTLVQAQDPSVLVTVTGLPELQPIADEATQRLQRAFAQLPASPTSAA